MIEGADRSMMDSALYAAQRAAQETLLKQGLLPSTFRDQNTPPDLEPESDIMEMEYGNGPDFPPPQNFPSGPPPSLDWRSGAPPTRPPPPFYRGGPRGGQRGHQDYNKFPGRGMMHPMGPRGQFPMRGFPPRPPNGNFERPRFNHHNNRKDFGGPGGRPCKFWMSQGFCREESRCRFSHPAR